MNVWRCGGREGEGVREREREREKHSPRQNRGEEDRGFLFYSTLMKCVKKYKIFILFISPLFNQVD
jgi:hypothetical protein